jgi:replication-associated recombination protein RarA
MNWAHVCEANGKRDIEEFGYGKGYKYAHDFAGGIVQQEYFPNTFP